MKTKQEITFEAKTMADTFARSTTTAGQVAYRLSTMIQDLASALEAECEPRDTSRSSPKPKWDIKKLDAIAVRIGLEVARVDDRIEVLHNGLTIFAGDPEPAAGFLLGWERCCIDRWRRTNKAGR